MRRIALLALVVAGCGASLTPVEPPAQPGGSMAVQFTGEFAAGHWDEGVHGYRLRVVCPGLGTNLEPPVARLRVATSERLIEERVWLRFDGPSTTPLSPSDLAAIHPDQATSAVITLTGLTEPQARLAADDCAATVVYDGNAPEPLTVGAPFTP